MKLRTLGWCLVAIGVLIEAAATYQFAYLLNNDSLRHVVEWSGMLALVVGYVVLLMNGPLHYDVLTRGKLTGLNALAIAVGILMSGFLVLMSGFTSDSGTPAANAASLWVGYAAIAFFAATLVSVAISRAARSPVWTTWPIALGASFFLGLVSYGIVAIVIGSIFGALS